MKTSFILGNLSFARYEVKNSIKFISRAESNMIMLASTFSDTKGSLVAAQIFLDYSDKLEKYEDELNTIELKLIQKAFSYSFRSIFSKSLDVSDLIPIYDALNRLARKIHDDLGTMVTFSKGIKSLELFYTLLSQWSSSIKSIEASLLYFEKILGESERKLPVQSWDFIKDDVLRVILERDYEELVQLLKINATKSTIVLSGSILEGILVAILSSVKDDALLEYKKQFPKKREMSLERWALYDLTCVAAGLKIIKPDTQKTSDFVRNYRNIVHPSVEIRENSTVDDELALVIVTLLKRVLRDVTL